MKQHGHEALGDTIVPSHYAIHFEPDIKTSTFYGTETIEVYIPKPTRIVTLHAKELNVTAASFIQNKKNVPFSITLNKEKEQLILALFQPLQGKAQLYLKFQGFHNEKMYGFYKSKYTLNGKEQTIFTTQFEPANARAAFPCIDEPSSKATFDVSLSISQNLTAISNMPLKKEKSLPKNKKQVFFQTTPRMSTYLLYIGIGNFKSVSTKHNTITINIYTTPEKINYAALPLYYTKTFLAFFEEYFQIKYPLPKLDIIAIPDFASGAMENWGAITFREIALLGNENTSVAIKQNIAVTIAHELAHQWFGNLVTMNWWDDLWLNESFATFMSYKAVHAAFPEWQMPLQYFQDTIADALASDELENTHPINVTVHTPEQIDEIFDQISYDKGGSVLHMLERYVGEKFFRQGLKSYIRKHAYKNATKHDLWRAIQTARKEPGIGMMMQDWITQPGYPVVTVHKNPTNITLSQQRFTLTGKKYPQQWRIPLTYCTSEGKQDRFLLKAKTASLTEKPTWIKLNHQQSGFYRVQYEPDHLHKIAAAFQREKKLSHLDMAGIEDDLFAFTVAGHNTMMEYLTFIEKFCLHAEYPLNAMISSHLGWLIRSTWNTPLYEYVHKISLLYHTALYQKLGWKRKENEKNTDTMLRSMTLMSLGLIDHHYTLEEAKRLFVNLLAGDQSIDNNIRGVIYSLAAWKGDEKTFSVLLERYKKEKLPEESRKLLRSLGMFQQEALKRKVLNLCQSEHVRLQDSFILPMTVASTPKSGELLLVWTKKHWRTFLKKYKPGTHMLPAFVHALSGIDTKKQRADVASFFAKKENMRDDICRAVQQTLERIEINIQFLEKNLKNNITWNRLSPL